MSVRSDVLLWAQRVIARRDASPHQILEVDEGVDLAAAQEAFHKIARVAHPDLHRGSLTDEDLALVAGAYARVSAAYQDLRRQAAQTGRMPPLAPDPPPPRTRTSSASPFALRTRAPSTQPLPQRTSSPSTQPRAPSTQPSIQSAARPSIQPAAPLRSALQLAPGSALFAARERHRGRRVPPHAGGRLFARRDQGQHARRNLAQGARPLSQGRAPASAAASSQRPCCSSSSRSSAIRARRSSVPRWRRSRPWSSASSPAASRAIVLRAHARMIAP